MSLGMRFTLKLFAGLNIVFCALFLFLVSEVKGGSASGTLGVNVVVNKNCVISTTPLAFGVYDPIIANSSSPLDATGTVTITCTKGAATTIGMGTSGGAAREMSSGAATMSYEIYRDASRTSIWAGSAPGLLDSGIAPDRNPRTFNVNGRIPGGQDLPSGGYSGTIVATVNF